MNSFFWFLLGMVIGSVATYWGIILYAKYMNPLEKEAAIKRARKKWGKE